MSKNSGSLILSAEPYMALGGTAMGVMIQMGSIRPGEEVRDLMSALIDKKQAISFAAAVTAAAALMDDDDELTDWDDEDDEDADDE